MTLPNKSWELAPPPAGSTLPGAVPAPISALLHSRGITTPEDLAVFLDPPHHLPHNPMRFNEMDRALARIYQAVERRETVGVFGDFDVDGITGTAIITEGLTNMGVPVVPYLPHRRDEGHGLSPPALRRLAEQGVGLLITVDCGVTAAAEVAQAREMGMDAIITDHHTPTEDTPDAVAIINPRMSGNRYPFGDLCGAGIAFKLIQGLYQFYGQPWAPELLELAALGTIADLVPLLDENRFFVQQGLSQLSQTRRAGLLALYRQGNIDPARITAETVSFQIAPRLNAAGRMSHAEESLRLLTTSSEQEAEFLARRLEDLNLERRRLTEQGFTAARQQVESLPELPPILVVTDPIITPGVAGLVAGRLAELYGRPGVVMADIGEDRLVASGRSVPGFNLVESFAACADLFVRYGGHAQAAGFTVERDQVHPLRDRLNGLAADAFARQPQETNLELDARLELADLNPGLVEWLGRLEPFGVGNPAPMFLVSGLQVVENRRVGATGQHLRLRVRQGGRQCTALAFNQADRWPNVPSTVDIAGSVLVDHWNGMETVNLKIADLRSATS